MGTRRHATGGFFGGQNRPKRKAATKAFCRQHDIGRDTGPFMGKQASRPAYTALHLIQDQQHTPGIAQRP